jgi:hypothetical protein
MFKVDYVSCKRTVGKFNLDMFPSKYIRPEELPNNSENVNFIQKIPAKVNKVLATVPPVSHIVPLITFFSFLPCCEHETCLNKASDCISCSGDYVYLNNSSCLFLEQITRSSPSLPLQVAGTSADIQAPLMCSVCQVTDLKQLFTLFVSCDMDLGQIKIP